MAATDKAQEKQIEGVDDDVVGGLDDFIMQAQTRVGDTGAEVAPGDDLPEDDDDNDGDGVLPGEDLSRDEPGGDTPDLKAADGGDHPTGDDPDGADGRKFRFKDHAAAEKGYDGILSRVTRAEQKAAAASKRVDAIEQKDKDAQTQAAADAVAREKDQFIDSRYEDVIAGIEELDPTDPEYNKQKAALWAKAHKDIAAYKPDNSRTPEGPINGRLSPRPNGIPDASPGDAGGKDEFGPADYPSGPGVTDDGENPSSSEEVKTYVQGWLDENNVDVDMEDPAFIYYAANAPKKDEDGNPYGIDEQLEIVVRQTKQYHDKNNKRNLQKKHQPMGRGGGGGKGGGGSPSSNEKISISDALDHVASLRRI